MLAVQLCFAASPQLSGFEAFEDLKPGGGTLILCFERWRLEIQKSKERAKARRRQKIGCP
jgi:hypothetical protein